MDEKDALDLTLNKTAGQIDDLKSFGDQPIGSRPGIPEVEGDIMALELTGGPADVVSFHDVHLLKPAFEHVWEELFDQSIHADVEQFYAELTRLYDDAGLQIPDFSSLQDVQTLQNFLHNMSNTGGGVTVLAPPGGYIPVPWDIARAFPDITGIWSILTFAQKNAVQAQANIWFTATSSEQEKEARDQVKMIVAQAEAALGRLGKMITQISDSLSKPYAFDVFAPGSYNYGTMLTYRQRWEPLTYQAGDLVASIPLAPGEVRKYSKRRSVKKVRATREMEKSMRSHAEQSAETGRSEWDIMKRASAASNFKMTSEGSFNIGIGSISSGTQFGANQAAESSDTKRQFHEKTVKAAQDYRLERSLEVDLTETSEFDDTTTGEIANPNNELTVTYLFYELQRRYQVSEAIHRARPVIMVARDIPSPHEVTEAWAIEHQWIISRVLLDDLFRPALAYLADGIAAEEIGSEVFKANFEAQKRLVQKLEGEVAAQLKSRNTLRETVIDTGMQMTLAQAASLPTAAKIFTLGLAPDPGEIAADRLEASRAAAEARLKYTEEALADAQSKLKSASEALTYATKEYADALKRLETQSVHVDRLLIHLKDNIIYYMHAIWDHEVPDQRFYELYDQMVKLPTAPVATTVTVSPSSSPSVGKASSYVGNLVTTNIGWGPTNFALQNEVRLIEIADLDNPLGYKGNYTIFPLTRRLDITDFMMAEFLDDYLEVRDPDGTGPWSVEQAEAALQQLLKNPDVTQAQKDQAKKDFLDKLSEARRLSDEVIIPSGQLFIEALPGRHPLLEDFKLRHRQADLKKVIAEVRHAELENLRLAVRAVKGHAKDELLADPDIDKNITLQANLDADIT